MEIWTSKVTFAHEETGKESTYFVKKTFEDGYPVCNIVDELIEMAAERLPNFGERYDFIDSDEEQVS